jgi:hypothetical protein
MTTRFWLLIAFVGIAGCFTPTYHDGNTRCSADGKCPRGYRCGADNRCWRNPPPTSPGDMFNSSDDMGTTSNNSDDMGVPQPISIAHPRPLWLSSGGGTSVAPVSGVELNFSLGGTWAVGSSTSNVTQTQFTSGFLCAENIK